MSANKLTRKPGLRSLMTALMEQKLTARAVPKETPLVMGATLNGDSAAMPLPETHPPVPASLALQIMLAILGVIAFLYFARAVVLPIVLAGVAGTAFKPLMRWLSHCHIPAPVGAALVLGVFVSGIAIGFVHLSRPAMAWVNEAPQHMAVLRQRMDKIFRPAARISQVAAAVNNLATTEEEQKKAATVQVKDNHIAGNFINWTKSLLVSLGETLVLLYLLLASGDLFLQKLVRISPTLHDKRRAVEISHEVQQNISNYLFAVSLINLGFGLAVWGGLYLIGVPNAALWGTLAALLNYIPYFGPIAGITLLGVVGLLTFETLPQGLLPLLLYLMLHLLEANFITPILLGRRFTLNPVVIFVSLIFWTWLWGAPGALLSVPILIYLKAICDRMPALASVSEFLVK